jgi:hypothetical protein
MMPEDQLRYDRMVEDALRTVVRQALEFIAENGLPGKHHFYITFRTDHPDVEMPDSLRESYQGEMTIVLQNRFWGLDVGEAAFGVTLSFEHTDPSVRFALQFDSGEADDLDALNEEDEEEAAVPHKETKAETSKKGKKKPKGKGDSANVVTLDTFRKK